MTVATMRCNKGIALLQNNRGSSTLYVVFVLPVMITMVILVIDIGQLIFERIRLQTTVDSCVLAAAAQQSLGLNEIADLNWSADQEYKKAKSILAGWPWYNSSHANRAFQFHKKVLDSIDSYQRSANFTFAKRAEIYAQRVKNQNLPNATLFSIAPSIVQSSLMQQDRREIKTVTYRYYATSCTGKDCYPVAPTKMYRWPDDPRRIGAHITFWPNFTTRRMPVSVTRELKVRWRKRTPPMTYVAYGLTQTPKSFLLGNRLFDLSRTTLLPVIPDSYRRYINGMRKSISMPRMTAYAAAKPFNGNVFSCKPQYQPMIYRLNQLKPSPMIYGYLGKMEH